MKYYIIYTLIFFNLWASSVQGQEKVRKTDSVDYRFALGVQLGTDIGEPYRSRSNYTRKHSTLIPN